MVKCKNCNIKFDTWKKFEEHVINVHGLKSGQKAAYYKKHLDITPSVVVSPHDDTYNDDDEDDDDWGGGFGNFGGFGGVGGFGGFGGGSFSGGGASGGW